MKIQIDLEDVLNLLRNVLQKCINESLQNPCSLLHQTPRTIRGEKFPEQRKKSKNFELETQFYSVCLARCDRTFRQVKPSRFFLLLCSYFFLSECHTKRKWESDLIDVIVGCKKKNWRKKKKKKFFCENLNWKKIENQVIYWWLVKIASVYEVFILKATSFDQLMTKDQFNW